MNIKDIPVYRSSDLATTNYRMDSYSRQSKGNDPQLAKIMPGCYIPISDYERVTQEELHLLRVYIAADAARRRNTPARKLAQAGAEVRGQCREEGPCPWPVFAGESAALLHGLPMVGPMPNQVQVISGLKIHASVTTWRRTRSWHYDSQPVQVEGMYCTDVLYTLADLLCSRDFYSGIASVDYVLREKIATKQQILTELGRRIGCKGVIKARDVVKHADARSESVGESLSRAVMLKGHLPMPRLQETIYDHGNFVGRVDFYWPDFNIIGEFDGLGKYNSGTYTDLSPGQIAQNERQRENALELATGARVVRWTWREAVDKDALLVKLGRVGIEGY